MKPVLAIALGVALLWTTGSAEAQDRWSLEARGGMAFATEDLGDTALDPGPGLEATVAYRWLPHLAAYAGWAWSHFTPAESFAGMDADVEETGYTFGLRFIHPFAGERLGTWSYVLSAGAIVDHIEVEDGDGEIIADTEHGLGWEVGAGLSYAFGESWSLVPSVRYRSLSRDLERGGGTTPVDLRSVSAGLAVSRGF